MTLINQTDSLSVSNDALVEVYKAMLDHQISNQNITVTILLAITLILIGVQWWFNEQGVKKLIEEGISSRMETERKTIELTISKLVDEKMKNTSNEILSLEGDAARLMAITAEINELNNWSVVYWANFLKANISLEQPRKIAIGVHMLIKCFKKDMDPFDKGRLEIIKATIDIIPDHFFREKEELLSLCKTFKTKD
jgi:hypothetical protein